MNILLLLSEEVFDFSSGQMTQDKMKQMKKVGHRLHNHTRADGQRGAASCDRASVSVRLERAAERALGGRW